MTGLVPQARLYSSQAQPPENYLTYLSLYYLLLSEVETSELV